MAASGARRASASRERGDSARRVGDEPLLLARVAPCYVGPDRVASARLAIDDGASVLIMDDGLQNPSLEKTLTVAVVDGEAPFGNGLCLPAGPLRAPVKAQMPYVDALVLIGGGEAAAAQAAAVAPGKPLFRARLMADAIAASRADRPAGSRLRRDRQAVEVFRDARRHRRADRRDGKCFPTIGRSGRARSSG